MSNEKIRNTLNKRQRIQEGAIKKMDNQKKLATQGIQDERTTKTQLNMCWTPLCANKHKIQDVIPLQTTGDKDQCFNAEFVTDITADLQAYKTGEI